MKTILVSLTIIVCVLLAVPPTVSLLFFLNEFSLSLSLSDLFSPQYYSSFYSALLTGPLLALGTAFILSFLNLAVFVEEVRLPSAWKAPIILLYFSLLALLLPPWIFDRVIESLKARLEVGDLQSFSNFIFLQVAGVVSFYAFSLYFFLLTQRNLNPSLTRSWQELSSGRLETLKAFRISLAKAFLFSFLTVFILVFIEGVRFRRLVTKNQSVGRFFDDIFLSASDDGKWVYATVIIAMVCIASAVVYFTSRLVDERSRKGIHSNKRQEKSLQRSAGG